MQVPLPGVTLERTLAICEVEENVSDYMGQDLKR